MPQTNLAQSTEPVNILVTIDGKYVYPLSVMLTAYSDLHPNIETHLYIAHSSLTEDDILFLTTHTANSNIKIHNVFIKERWFADTPVLERLPQESFYRLMAFHFLPQTVHRCLYLDPDILICKSLLPLYYMDMKDNYIAAASHTYRLKNKLNLMRLAISTNDRYINSGVMLMNLDAIRQDFTIESILAALNKNIQKLWLGDQDLINILFGRNSLLLDEKIYNLDERTFRHYQKSFDLQQVEKQTSIIHYNGKYKPWLNGYKGKLNCFYPEIVEKGPAPTGKWKEQIQAIYNIIHINTQQKIFFWGILGVLSICIFFWMLFGKELIKIVADPNVFHTWLKQFGIFDELIFILIRTLQTVIKIIPAVPLEIASGYAWGSVLGMLYCIIGNMLGTLIILSLTKHFGKNMIKKIASQKKLDILATFQDSGKIYVLLFFIYLIPGSPKDGLTYLVGLLEVKTIPFMIISFVARIPSVLSYTLCGATLAGEQYFISVLLFSATILLALLGGFIYKKHFKERNFTCKPSRLRL